MSQFLGKATNALVSVSNENTFALGNLNLGFSLVKLEAPAEYHPVGSALTIQRRHTAEVGTQHQTARTLGALFSPIIPDTPKLLQAFGQRASTIITAPGANPKGSLEDGPFRDSVGADATSIWASATSGSASLAVLLLASLLARKFDDPKLSVAVWAEIVSIRQKEVLESAQSTGFVMNETVVAAQLKIPREELAMFDASVRAWLMTADQVMVKKLKQLKLIVDNLTTLPVSAGKDTYSKIINAWMAAMSGFEALLEGKPQNATDSSVLLALSAWHLYPDLIVLSTEIKKVVFHDELFPATVAITVGLTLRDDTHASPGFHWSLALSHLRYYGEPVNIEIDHDNFRITMDELCLISLGSLLTLWSLPNTIIKDLATWFCSLEDLLKSKYADDPLSYGNNFTWLQALFRGSRVLLVRLRDESAAADCVKLVRYGRRRGSHLLGAPSSDNSPLFGLTNPHVLRALRFPSLLERSLEYLRSISEGVSLPTHAIIKYQEVVGDEVVVVLATATPFIGLAPQMAAAGMPEMEKVHARWVVTDSHETFKKICMGFKTQQESSSEFIGSLPTSTYIPVSRPDPNLTDQPPQIPFLWVKSPLLREAAVVDASSRSSHVQVDEHVLSEVLSSREQAYPILTLPRRSREFSSSRGGERADLDGCNPDGEAVLATGERGVHFGYVCGFDSDSLQIGLFSAFEDNGYAASQLKQVLVQLEKSNTATLAPEDALRGACLENLHQGSVLDFLDGVSASEFLRLDDSPISNNFQRATAIRRVQYQATDYTQSGYVSSWGRPNLQSFGGSEWSKGLMRLDVGQGAMSDSCRLSLTSLGLMCQLYAQFPAATFPNKVIERPFVVLEKWIDFTSRMNSVSLNAMTRSEALASICMMELGGASLDPTCFERAFAVAAGNSIFVTETLLSDPAKEPSHHAIRRIVGNLGRPGVSILVNPEEPMVKEKTSDYRVIEHAPYNYRREDSFRGVSLHLTLTDWKMPISFPDQTVGNIDQDVFQTEAVVSVYDGGKWFADIDVVKLCKPHRKAILSGKCTCGKRQATSVNEYASLDNFEELLDFPETRGIFRAYGNWPARLAASCIVRQKIYPNRALVLSPNEIEC